MTDATGSVALVAGGSRGIGAETAKAFAGSSFITGATIPIDGGQLAGNKPPQMYRQGEGMTPTRGPGPAAPQRGERP